MKPTFTRRLRSESLESRLLLAGDVPLVSTSPVLDWGSGFVPVEGASSKLARTDEGVSMTFETSQLNPGAYTMWLIMFNNPEFCQDACGPDDLGSPTTEATAHYVDARIVGEDGRATFAAALQEGDITGVQDVFADFAGMKFTELPGADSGLIDSMKAEYHMVLQHHGDVSDAPAVRSEQLTMYLGGCNPECIDVQSSGHLPSRAQGDFDADMQVTSKDVDLLFTTIRRESSNAIFDLSGDMIVDQADVDQLLGDVLDTRTRDTNLDGSVDFEDFTRLSHNFGQEGGWAKGDNDGDGLIGFSDFLRLAGNFGYGA